MSFMERQVLGYKSPLYGRRNAQLKIEPFDYYDSAAFFENTSFEDKILGYAVTGGIPQYLREINGYNSISEGIQQSFFNKFGSLYEEPQNLLKQELREPAVYNTIIASIANGASKLNDISTKSGEENKKTSKYLTALIQLGIIERELPVGGIGKRNGVYRIKDNMYRFWYKFVPENVTNIESGNYEYVYKNKVEPFLSDYVGRIFEDVCRQFMLRENTKGKLPFVFDKIGRWWGTNPVSRNQEEIDVMAVSKKSAIFCECKWKNELMDMTVLNELKRKAKTFGQYSEKYFYLFSKSGFKSNLTELSKTDDHICLICLADLF
jgi:AAA+ ATPase superfamily predicted ATPase